MFSALLRLIALLALVLMPFAMGSAPASAQSKSGEHSSASVGHCDEQRGQNDAPVKSPQLMHCGMCTAIPAAETPAPITGLIPSAPRTMAPVALFNGIELEIATPPPKHA